MFLTIIESYRQSSDKTENLLKLKVLVETLEDVVNLLGVAEVHTATTTLVNIDVGNFHGH